MTATNVAGRTCLSCGLGEKAGPIMARGLHSACYGRHRADGTLDQFPRVSPDEYGLKVEGVSYRQLDYWVKRGWLHPDPRPHEHSGVTRTWPAEEVRVARIMGRLKAAGLTPEAAHRIARLATGGGELAPGVWVLYDHHGPTS
jgi:MerR HTH family regulatory protein